MRKLSISVIAAALAVTFIAPAAQAGTTFIPFTCQENLVANPDGGTAWVDEEMVLHVRGWLGTYEVTGSPYCAGTGYAVANFNLDLLTGEGNLWGTNRYELAAFDGGYDMSFTAHWTNPDPLADDATDIWAGRYVGHGYGEMTSWQIRGEMIERTHALVEEWGRVWQAGG